MALADSLWYRRNPLALLLWPMAFALGAITAARRHAYRVGLLHTQRFKAPVIVVGNISAGGTGKTPLVIWLAHYLKSMGLMPGIVTRGYGGKARHWPQQVRPDSDPIAVGDEAIMLASRTNCPMCVGPDRPAAVTALLAHTKVNVVLCDDGLQHYALGRDLEIAVVDGRRRFGNGLLQPAGPLREPVGRLKAVDLVVFNGQARRGELSMQIAADRLQALDGATTIPFESMGQTKVHAVAGIGNPSRFFDLLAGRGLSVVPHAFPDHHAFKADDIAFDGDIPVLMTEKDAVKCRRLPCRNCWVVPIDAQPEQAFVDRLARLLEEILDGQEAARYPGLSDLQRKAGVSARAKRADMQD